MISEGLERLKALAVRLLIILAVGSFLVWLFRDFDRNFNAMWSVGEWFFSLFGKGADIIEDVQR